MTIHWEALRILLKLTLFSLFFRYLIAYIYRHLWNPLSHQPGPLVARFTDWYGAYHSALGQLHVRTFENHQQYGSVFRQGPNRIVFNTVTAFHDINTCKIKSLQKSRGYLSMLPAPGVYNIHTAIDKNLHRFKRRVISQGLSDQCMRDFEPSLLKHVDKFIRNLAKVSGIDKEHWSVPVNMTEQCKYLGFDIMGEFGFGKSFDLLDKPSNRFLTDAVTAASRRSAVYAQFPDLAKAKLDKVLYPRASSMRMKYMNLVKTLLHERLKAETDEIKKYDLFSFIEKATDSETGQGFSHDELWSEARFLLIAGSDTTSSALAALFFYLSRYPDCYKKVAEEVRHVFTSARDIHCGLNSSMPQCIYLRACIDEAMRMTPPVGGILWREVSPGSGGIMIDGHYVPEGCDVGASIYCVQHNEDYFPNSFKFDPDRWIVSDTNPKGNVELAKQAFSVFSSGPRGCPGKTMSYMEISNAMAKTLWYFDFKAAEGELGAVGAGHPSGPKGRRRPEEFQVIDHLSSTHKGPYIHFKSRVDSADFLG